MFILMIENTDAAYSRAEGMVGNHAVFDPAVLDIPSSNDTFRSVFRRWSKFRWNADKVSVITYPFNPLDAIGWHMAT